MKKSKQQLMGGGKKSPIMGGKNVAGSPMNSKFKQSKKA